MSQRQPLQLTDRFWQELEDMGSNSVLPLELARHLREVINCHYRRAIQPAATARLIALAKEHLSEGIVISTMNSEDHWQLLIYSPDNPETHRTFFVLVPNFPYGQLKRLAEFEAPEEPFKEECQCPCHSGNAMHCMPCCDGACPICSRTIIRGQMAKHIRERHATGKKTLMDEAPGNANGEKDLKLPELTVGPNILRAEAARIIREVPLLQEIIGKKQP